MVSLTPIKTVSILGCGWFGFALAKKLLSASFKVKASTTSISKLERLQNEGISTYLLNFNAENQVEDSDFFNADVLFICIPPKRNSAEFLDYPNKIKKILQLAKNRSMQLVFISSTSVYGDTNSIVDEYSALMPDTESGKLMLTTENLVLEEKNSTIIRFAGLFGPERNPGRFFAGKKDVANGLAPVNLIHQSDAVGIAVAIIKKGAFGRVYNACATTHPTKKDFYTLAAKNTGLEKPQFIEEKINWKIVNSVNVPDFLDYKFQVEV